ncbi:hypothetical protein EDB86DRAFT_2828229 [Lactarius hatsudake]|nr:hypothetical protein EDB86DRAFT_2828229 [Lactarius hatsudake]
MSHSFEHYLTTGGHLDTLQAAMTDGDDDGQSQFSDDSDHASDGLNYIHATITHQLKLYDDNNERRGKALYADDLCYWLNTPAPSCDGLSPLHWLGLNPLVKLGAPTCHFGPPPDTSILEGLADTFADTTRDLLNPFFSPFQDIDGSVQGGFSDVNHRLDDVNKKLDFLARSLLSRSPASTPSSPPSATPVAAPAQDVEMARPPTPAPVPPPAPAPTAAVLAPESPAPVPAPAPAPVSKPRAKKPRAQPPTPAPATVSSGPAHTPAPPTHPTPSPARPTPSPAPKPSFASMAKSPARPSLVVSLQSAVAGGPKPLAVCRGPQELVAHLNAVLASEGHSVTLSAARWTAKNNLVVTAGPDTTAHHLTSASHLISDSLVTFLSADNSPLPVQTRENCKWARLMINGIPTGASLTHGPYTPSELHAALLADNPVYRKLRLTQPPSWVRAPTSYTPGSVSSVVMAFEDPSRDSLRSLMAERTLFAFGHSGELKRWKAKPRNTGKAKPAASS